MCRRDDRLCPAFSAYGVENIGTPGRAHCLNDLPETLQLGLLRVNFYSTTTKDVRGP